MTARWFVMSRGQRPHQDYHWQPAGPCASAVAEDVMAAGWRGRPGHALVDDERPGLLFFDRDREPRQLVLLVTGLAPVTPVTDHQNRPIRTSVLGVADAGDQPGARTLAAVAARALRGDLAGNLPVTYDGSTQTGFQVDAAAWHSFTTAAYAELGPPAGPAAGRESLVLPDTEENRRKVAAELAILSLPLPAVQGALAGRILVLRTSRADQQVMQTRPWRVLSEQSVDPRPATPGELSRYLRRLLRPGGDLSAG